MVKKAAWVKGVFFCFVFLFSGSATHNLTVHYSELSVGGSFGSFWDFGRPF